MNESFDEQLESELRASLTRVTAWARPPALSSLLEAKAPSTLGLFGRRLSTSTAAGIAAAALAVAGGGYAAASVANGSPNPAVWGQQVRQQVESCQDQRASGPRVGQATEERGIGSCVSTFARQNGEAHQAQHAGVRPSPPAKGEDGQPGSSSEHGQPGSSGEHGQPGSGGEPEHGKPTPAPKGHPTPGHGHASPKG